MLSQENYWYQATPTWAERFSTNAQRMYLEISFLQAIAYRTELLRIGRGISTRTAEEQDTGKQSLILRKALHCGQRAATAAITQHKAE